MQRILTLTVMAVFFTAISFAGAARAETYGYGQSYDTPSATPVNTTHYLRLPTGYQDNYNAQGTYQNPYQQATRQANAQALQQQSGMYPAGSAPVAANTAPLPPLTVENVPARMLPQPVIVQSQAVQSPVQTTVNASSTATYGAFAVNDGAGTVRMGKLCETGSNHRARNKAMNTSTTVTGDCID